MHVDSFSDDSVYMSNSGCANSGRRRLEAAPMLPHKLQSRNPNAASGRLIEHPDSDSFSASTQRPQQRRQQKSPSQRKPMATPPPHTHLARPNPFNLVESELTCPQALHTQRNEI
jgi:hypothetical protein